MSTLALLIQPCIFWVLDRGAELPHSLKDSSSSFRISVMIWFPHAPPQRHLDRSVFDAASAHAAYGVGTGRGRQPARLLPTAWGRAQPLRDDDCVSAGALAGNKVDGDAGSMPQLPGYGGTGES